MRRNSLAASVLTSTFVLTHPLVHAADLRIDGFASIYAGQTLDEDRLGDEKFLGYDSKTDFQQNSLYGIQFRSDLKENLSATAQIVGKGAEEFDPKITWAFLKYNFSEEFSVKAGRQRVPFFLYSDFIQVGYAYTWVAPPDELYNIAGNENIDGVNFEYLTDIGDWTSRTSLLIGASNSNLDFNGSSVSFANDDFRGLTWDLTYDWFTFHAVYSRSKVTLSAYNDFANGISGAMSSINPALALSPDQIDLLDLNEDAATYKGVGISADWGDWLAATEYAEIELDESPTTTARKGWYVFGGYRWQKYTFGLTYAKFKSPNNPKTIDLLQGNNFVLGGPTPTTLEGWLGAAQAGAEALGNSFGAYGLGQLIDNLPSLYRGGKDSKSYTATVRYDFHPSAALKFEYVMEKADYDLSDGSSINTIEPTLLRVGVDLVF